MLPGKGQFKEVVWWTEYCDPREQLDTPRTFIVNGGFFFSLLFLTGQHLSHHHDQKMITCSFFPGLILWRWGIGWKCILANLSKYRKGANFFFILFFVSTYGAGVDVVFPLLRVHQNELTCKIKSVFDDDVCQLLYVISDLYHGVFQRTLSAQQALSWMAEWEM